MKDTKRIGIMLGIGILMAGLAFGDAAAEFDAAMKVYQSGDLTAAKAAFEAIPNNATARAYVGHCLARTGKHAEAQKEFESALALTTNLNLRAGIQNHIGRSLYAQQRYAESQAAMESLLATYPAALPAIRVDAQYFISLALRVQGRFVDANDASVKYIVMAVRTKSVDKNITGAFDSIKPELMTTDAYKAALQDILKATPAIETNTAFLSQIKSEYEKIK